MISVYSFGSAPTSAVKSPLLIFTVLPALIASGILAITLNISKRPTAVRTEPSITPTGGTKKPHFEGVWILVYGVWLFLKSPLERRTQTRKRLYYTNDDLLNICKIIGCDVTKITSHIHLRMNFHEATIGNLSEMNLIWCSRPTCTFSNVGCN